MTGPISDQAARRPAETVDAARAAVRATVATALDQMIRGVVVVALVALIGFTLTAFVYGDWATAGLYAGLFAVVVALAYARRLPVAVRGGIFVGVVYAVAVISLAVLGIGGAARVFLVGFSVLTTVIFGTRAGVAAAGLSLLTWLGFGALFTLGLLAPSAPPDSALLVDWISAAASLALIIVALIIPQRQLLQARVTAVSSTHEVAELEAARAQLAERGEQLARASQAAEGANRLLEEQSSTLEHRARLLGLSAEVAHAAAGVRDLTELLQSSVDLVSQRFGYYHAGLFLLDDAREWAVLRAASSVPGRAMVARGHRLRAGHEGIVGFVTGTGKPRVAQDVGGDVVHYANPNLPDTRSEIGVPLTVRGAVIGALDVQSTEPNAFGDEDGRVLSTLADQIAVAIDNTQLLAQTQQRLAELQDLQQVTRRGAAALTEAPLAFRYDGVSVAPLAPEAEPTAVEAAPGTLAVPIEFGDQRLATLELRRPGEPFSPDEMVLIGAVAERMGLALESAQVFEQTRARAQQLATLSQVALEFTGPQFGAEQVLDRVAAGARRLFAVDGAGIWLPASALAGAPSEAPEIELKVSHNVGTAGALDWVGRRLKAGEGMAGRVFATGQPVRVDDYAAAPDSDAAFADAAYRSVLAVPMMWQGRAQGVLMLTHSQPGRPFTADDENIAQLFAAQAASTLENSRLFTETQQRVTELATINGISQQLASQLDEAGLVELVGREVGRAFGHSALVALYDARAGLVSLPYVLADDGSRGAIEPVALGEGLTSHVITSRRPLLINRDTERRAAELGARLQGQPARSWLGVPIMAGDQVLGAIVVQDLEQEGLFSDDDVRLLTTIAANAGVALQNARLFQQTGQRADELAAINRLSQALSSRLDLRALSELVVDSLCQTFSVNNAYLALYDRDSNRIELPYMIEDGQPVSIGPFTLGGGLTSHIIQARQPLLINAGAEARMAELGALTTGKPARSFLGVPVFAGDEVVGVVSVQDLERENRFSDDDVRLLATIAANAGVAVQNARLFQQTQERAAELAVVNELARSISEALDPAQVLQTVYDQVQRLLPLDGFFVSLYDPASGLQTTPLIYEAGRRSEEGPRPVPARGLIRTVIDSGQPLVINRTPDEIERIAMSPEHAMGHAAQVAASLIYLPLFFGQQVGGVMSVQSYTPDAYGARQLAVLAAVGSHVVVALQNARLFEETQRRADQLAAASEVARAATSVLETDDLVRQSVELIRDRFERSTGVYYVALFLLDESGQWARLQHATGAAGRSLLERQHRLEVGGNSMVGWSTANRQARIALDVGAEPVRFANPLLPNTRSELALPLVVGDTVLGALDVQSTKSGAFSDADVAVLQTMADQIAVAIRNAQLHTAVQAELAERQKAEASLLKFRLGLERTTDAVFITATDGTILYANPSFEKVYGWAPAEAAGHTPRILKSGLMPQEQYQVFWGTLLNRGAIAGELINRRKDGTLIQIEGANSPIIDDAGNLIGFLGVHRDITERKRSEAALMAAESSAQRRARREELVVSITSKIRATNDIDAMLRIAVTELRQALGTSHGAVRVGPPRGAPGSNGGPANGGHAGPGRAAGGNGVNGPGGDAPPDPQAGEGHQP